MQPAGTRGKRPQLASKEHRVNNNIDLACAIREREPMQLSRLWREHLEAGCPNELAGVEIAGTEARTLDAEISACVSALLTRTFTVDGRIERRLTEISTALCDKRAAAEEPVAQYCERLNRLVSAVLMESKGGRA
jgi:hypothetical protein